MPLRFTSTSWTNWDDVAAFQNNDDIREYLDHERLECLLCGQRKYALASHLVRVHGINARMYKQKFNIPIQRGLTGVGVRKRASAIAIERGLGDKDGKRISLILQNWRLGRRQRGLALPRSAFRRNIADKAVPGLKARRTKTNRRLLLEAVRLASPEEPMRIISARVGISLKRYFHILQGNPDIKAACIEIGIHKNTKSRERHPASHKQIAA